MATISKKIKERTKDLLCWQSFPFLREHLHRSMRAGLETLLDYQRLAMLVAALDVTRKMEGDVIEFGTFRGGSAGVILQNLGRDKTLYVCDSFEGMPETVGQDNFHRKGDFSATASERVENGLSELGSSFRLVKGFFNETLPELSKTQNLKISFAHVDADLYESVSQSLEFCYPRMSQGSVLIFDDYGAPTCLGAKKAVDEFFANRSEHVARLSGDQHGCIVGGGDAFERLMKTFSLISRSERLTTHVFPRG